MVVSFDWFTAQVLGLILTQDKHLDILCLGVNVLIISK